MFWSFIKSPFTIGIVLGLIGLYLIYRSWRLYNDLVALEFKPTGMGILHHFFEKRLFWGRLRNPSPLQKPGDVLDQQLSYVTSWNHYKGSIIRRAVFGIILLAISITLIV